jgi:hypothetical protein
MLPSGGELMGRGLSPLQTAIMKHADEHGYITPSKAVECAWRSWDGSTSKNYRAIYSVSASRALCRLVSRGLLKRKSLLTMRACKIIRRPTVYTVLTFTGPYEAAIGTRVCRECEARNFIERFAESGGLEELRKETERLSVNS